MSAPGGKSRGCFQCSKRRIICDNTEPACKKCQKKGIECSGSGRIRFSTGVAQRGKLKGCSIPVVDGSLDSNVEPHTHAATSVPRKIRWKNDPPVRARRKNAKRAAQATNLETRQESDIGAFSQVDVTGEQPPATNKNDLTETDEYLDCANGQAVVPASLGSINPWIAPLNSKARMLMSHFAEQVAPVMVVLDNVSNGYREVLLPLACEDELLQRAVGVVAAQHLALHHPAYQTIADKGRAAIISRLRRDSLQTSPDRVFNLSTWATLIVLLVGETITGSSEYGHLLQTLMCLFQNIDQIAPSAERRFLSQQTHMFEFLGQPLLGEKQGVNALRLPLDHYLDWIEYDLPPDSEHNHVLHIARMAFIKASQIYLGRVTADQDQWELLESLKRLVSRIAPDQMGSHALVWVCFIAAADSTDPEHRRFFVDRMNRIFAKTRFQNISAGMQSLSAIWSQQSSGRWTKQLTQLAPTLIM